MKKLLIKLLCISSVLCLVAAGCGGDDDDSSTASSENASESSSTESESSEEETSSAGLASCPDPIVIQTDWFPESEHGAMYELFGSGDYSIDAENLIVSGTLHNGGTDTGIGLEVRTGGPAIGFSPVASYMYTDDSITFGYANTEAQVTFFESAPLLSVVAPLEKNPQMVMWDPATYPNVNTLADLGTEGVTISVFGGGVFAEVFIAQGIWDAGQVDPSYDGSPANFIANGGSIAQQGFASAEPYDYETVFTEWGKPVKFQLLHDAGFPVYSQTIAIRSAEKVALDECLKAFVPAIQRATVSFVTNPDTANGIIIDAVETFGSFWVYSEGLADFSVTKQKQLGLVGNGPNNTVGDMEEARVQSVIDIMADAGIDTGGITTADIYTNEYIDPSIGFIADGTTLNLSACPDDWDPQEGVTDTEIRMATSLPQSGQLAAFGTIASGMQFYFDYVNATDPIDGKNIVLIAKDDAYEAGRTVANVQEMLETENILGFVGVIGTPNNAAIRPITNEACVPQLLNLSGFPFWGDPANYPWTVGNILNYVTETNIWCEAIVEEFGEGATVAGLFMNNDFGKTYQQTLQACSGIEVVAEALHDPAAPDVTAEMTTLASSGAEVFVAGTTAAFCPQSVGVMAATPWRPRFYMSYTCNNLPAFFTPVQDAAALLQAEGAGVRIANSSKVCGDPRFDEDPAIQLTQQVLAEYGDVTCADGSYSGGVFFAQVVVDILRAANDLPGGINRVNVMKATWNLDTTNGNNFVETIRLDGTNDAYITEGAQLQEVQVIDGKLTFTPVSEIFDYEGQGGSYGG